MTNEKLILRNLIQNESFTRKVLPYLNETLFQDRTEKMVFQEIKTYIDKYNKPPVKDALEINLGSRTEIDETDYKSSIKLIDELIQPTQEVDNDWLLDITEKWVQDRTLHNAIMDAIAIYDGSDKKRPKTAIPEIVSQALAVSFDPDVGHDYLEDAEERYEYYHRVEDRVPFDIEILNKITNGGLPKKTLNIFVGGINVGKSLVLCHLAAAFLKQHKKVLYITLEMSQEAVSQRVDANLMGVTMKQVEEMGKAEFDRKIANMRATIKGKLMVKEFPTAAASVLHFKAEIQELKLKKQFVPDVVIVDYVNICASSRVKMGNGVNTYLFIKMIAEELRGMAVEMKLPVVSATQLTRDGFGNSDPDMTDVAESFGLPATADWMVAMIADEQLLQINQILFKQIKTRYSNIGDNTKFPIGMNRDKMQLFDPDKQSLKVATPTTMNPIRDNRTFDPDTGEIPAGQMTWTGLGTPDKVKQAAIDEVMEAITKSHQERSARRFDINMDDV